MAARYEYYITGDNTHFDLSPARGEYFAPQVSHTITSVKIKLWGSASQIYVRIYYGENLIASGNVFFGGYLEPGTLWSCSLGAGADLTAGLTYTLMVEGGNSTNWRVDTTGNYPRGSMVGYGAYDLIFEEWGVPTPVIHYGSATLSGIGDFSTDGYLVAIGKATLAGIGTLVTDCTRIRTGVVALIGVGTLVTNGVITTLGKAVLSGIGILTTNGTIIVIGKAVLSGVGSLSTIGVRIRTAAASFYGAGILSVKGILVQLAKASLTGVGYLTAAGRIFAAPLIFTAKRMRKIQAKKKRTFDDNDTLGPGFQDTEKHVFTDKEIK